MRIAILSESPADEASTRILVEALIGIRTIAAPFNLQSRGWPAVRNALPPISKALHYNSDTEALVVVVDSNHTYLSQNEQKNRLWELQKLAQRCREELGTVSGRVPLKIAVGVAAPAIEAWWLCKSNPHISEAAWEKGLNEKKDPYSKSELKKQLYGSKFYSLAVSTQKMVEAANEISSELHHLEKAFPHGFGSLAKEIRSWRRIG